MTKKRKGQGRKSRKPKRQLRNLATPFERFILQQVTASSLLFGATILALIWANSPWGQSYTDLWHLEVGISAGSFDMIKPLHLWINDGLMAVFFFVIGLEIKRELIAGELSDPGKALLPVMAALGGMIVPVSMFLLVNNEPSANVGWGIPMATDIAFTLGILQLLGKRVPLSLKVFLTAFAIVDDLGAVVVIAIFYSHGINVAMLLGSLGILSLLGILSWRGYYNKYFYFICAIIVWTLFLNGGLHPTLAGVLMAFTIPMRRSINLFHFMEKLEDAVLRLGTPQQYAGPSILVTKDQLAALDDIDNYTDEVISPLQHLEYKLHGYVGRLIMPVFALANAGVVFSLGDGRFNGLILALASSMVVGKFAGIVSFSLVAIRFKWCKMPEGMTMRHLMGGGMLGGLGFTMALFIAGLAYPDLEMLGASKLGILIGSLVAGLGGYLILRQSPEVAELPVVVLDRPATSAERSSGLVVVDEDGSAEDPGKKKSGKKPSGSDPSADQPGDSSSRKKPGGGLAIGKTVYPKR